MKEPRRRGLSAELSDSLRARDIAGGRRPVEAAVAAAEAEAEAAVEAAAAEAEAAAEAAAAVAAAVLAAAAEFGRPSSTLREDSPLAKEEGRYSAESVPASSAAKKGCVRKSPAAARPA